MIGIAAGLTIGGKTHLNFANFSTGRVYDQIRQSYLTLINKKSVLHTPD
jgi:transketolase C-terminal domain/subunit